MWLAKLILVAFCGSTLAQLQDLTRQQGATGAQVVESVVSLIRETCVFPNDRSMLRRIAYVATNDGMSPMTYRPGFNGGIWDVSQQDFTRTQNDPQLRDFYTDIVNTFGINWNSVQWSDLRKPLYSGLAAALVLVQAFGDNVPVGIERQAAGYQRIFFPSEVMAAYNYTKQAGQIGGAGACGSYNLDLAYLVDSSASLNPNDFNDALDFAANVLDPFVVSPTAVQVAFMTFSTGFQTVFDFDQFRDKTSVQNAIRAAQYQPGQTDTDQALGYAASTLFSSQGGARPNSAKVAVIVTDGKATHGADAIARAIELRNKGVIVFVIGVGDEIDLDELNSLATKPNCTHVQVLKDYQDLGALISELQQLSCRAQVILKEGNYSFPCSTTSNYRININGNETITIHPTNGYVDIYGSFLNPYPNPAFNEFKTRATSAREAIIYVQDETRTLYLSIVSQGTDPVFCQAGNNYDIFVQNKNAIQPNGLLTCYQNGIVRQCTPLDILSAIYRVVQPLTLGFPNPCRPGHPGYFVHPFAYDRFIYCDDKGTAYLIFCPAGYWYNDNFRQCIFGTPPPAIVTTPSTSRPIVITSPPPQVTSAPGGNPCTQDALNRGDRFFPYSPDETKYIECTEWPNYGVIKDCEAYHKWSQHDLACIYIDTVVDPTHDLYVTSPAPGNFDCRPGLQDGDLFYHPFPADPHKFIQCDQFGDAFVLTCANNKVWNQNLKACVNTGLTPIG